MLNEQLGEPVQEAAEAQLEGGAPVHHQHDHATTIRHKDRVSSS